LALLKNYWYAGKATGQQSDEKICFSLDHQDSFSNRIDFPITRRIFSFFL